MLEINNIQKTDNYLGKGEVESSILSGSTRYFINEFSEISQAQWDWIMANRHLFGRKPERKKNKEGTC